MRIFVVKFLIFLVITATFYISSICILGDWFEPEFRSNIIYLHQSYGHLNSRLKEAEKKRNIDILVLGSSLAYRGFDPRIFKQSNFILFNLGSSGQTPEQTKYLLDRFLVQMNPKLIIYVINPLEFKLDGVESTLDLISNDNITFNTLSLVFKPMSIKTLNTFIYSFYRKKIRNENEIQEDKIKSTDTYINGGFVERKIDFLNYKDNLINDSSYSFKIKSFLVFVNSINSIQEKKIKLLLVQPPISKIAFAQNTKENIDFDKKISNYADYINYNKKMSMIDTLHFYDKYHLNQIGVKYFNAFLIKDIKENYLK